MHFFLRLPTKTTMVVMVDQGADTASEAQAELLRLRTELLKTRKAKYEQTEMLHMVKMSLLTVLAGALSFMGAFVFRDFFLALFKTSLENMGLRPIITNFIYLILVMLFAVPALAFVTWTKARAEMQQKKYSDLYQTT